MAVIRTTVKTEVTDASGQKTIIERQAEVKTMDNPRFWADQARKEMIGVERLVVSLLENAFGTLPPKEFP